MLNSGPFSQLPVDVIQYLLPFLGLPTLVKNRRVNRAFQHIIDNEATWKSYFKKKLPYLLAQVEASQKPPSSFFAIARKKIGSLLTQPIENIYLQALVNEAKSYYSPSKFTLRKIIFEFQNQSFRVHGFSIGSTKNIPLSLIIHAMVGEIDAISHSTLMDNEKKLLYTIAAAHGYAAQLKILHLPFLHFSALLLAEKLKHDAGAQALLEAEHAFFHGNPAAQISAELEKFIVFGANTAAKYYLLHFGYKITAQDKGITLLDAALDGNDEIVKFIMDNFINELSDALKKELHRIVMNIRETKLNDDTVLHILEQSFNQEDKVKYLLQAAYSNKFHLVQQFLEKYPNLLSAAQIKQAFSNACASKNPRIPLLFLEKFPELKQMALKKCAALLLLQLCSNIFSGIVGYGLLLHGHTLLMLPLFLIGGFYNLYLFNSGDLRNILPLLNYQFQDYLPSLKQRWQNFSQAFSQKFAFMERFKIQPVVERREVAEQTAAEQTPLPSTVDPVTFLYQKPASQQVLLTSEHIVVDMPLLTKKSKKNRHSTIACN